MSASTAPSDAKRITRIFAAFRRSPGGDVHDPDITAVPEMDRRPIRVDGCRVYNRLGRRIIVRIGIGADNDGTGNACHADHAGAW